MDYRHSYLHGNLGRIQPNVGGCGYVDVTAFLWQGARYWSNTKGEGLEEVCLSDQVLIELQVLDEQSYFLSWRSISTRVMGRTANSSRGVFGLLAMVIQFFEPA